MENRNKILKLCKENGILNVYKSRSSYSLTYEAFKFLIDSDINFYKINCTRNELRPINIIRLAKMAVDNDMPYFISKHCVYISDEIIYNMHTFYDNLTNFLEMTES